MPQEFLVVQCYSCQTFQIHQTRKDCKFVCKICGAKQSRKKVYAQGNSKDCRIAVQNLNAQMHQDFDEDFSRPFSEHEESFEEIKNTNQHTNFTDLSKSLESKWDEFLEPEDDSLDDDNERSHPNSNIRPKINSKEALSQINRKVLSEIDLGESSRHVNNRVLPSSFTTVKRFHDGEVKTKIQKEDKQDCVKENAIKKFQNVDDNILDILNTSFRC